MDKKQGLLHKWRAGMELPEQIFGADTVTELLGRKRVKILQHRGILEYTAACIRVRTRQGSVAVIGSGLELALMNREKIAITGRIDKLEFSGGEGI